MVRVAAVATVEDLYGAAPRWWCDVCQREVEDKDVALGSHAVNAGRCSLAVHQVRPARYPVNAR